jgi:putative spermidine/putrescine transport system permease protein
MSERGRSGVLGGALVILFAAPLAILALQAFADSWRAPDALPSDLGTRGFDVGFAQGNAADALFNSLVVGIGSTVVCLVVGWPAARAIAGRRLARRSSLLLLFALPLLMPPYLAGFGLTEWFIRLGIDGTLAGVVLAHVVFALPYAILILVSGFGADLSRLEEMARASGATPLATLRWVTIPSLKPVLATAGLLAFLVSWSQYGTTLAIGGGLPTLPIVMLPFVSSDPQVAAALALLFLVPALAALGAAARMGREVL